MTGELLRSVSTRQRGPRDTPRGLLRAGVLTPGGVDVFLFVRIRNPSLRSRLLPKCPSTL